MVPEYRISTGTCAHIRTELERRRIEKYSNIIIQAGGNDVDGRREYEAIENDFAEIIQDIHRRTPQTNVFIAEILPRRRLDMTDINKILGKVCELYGAKLIQTTKTISRVNAEQFLEDFTLIIHRNAGPFILLRGLYTNLKQRHQETDSSVLQLRGNRTYCNKLSIQRENTVLGMRTHGP